MGNNRQTNTWLSGMNMDLGYNMMKDSQYNYAENIRVVANSDNTIGTLQNIEGFFKTSPTQNLSNETIIHVNTIRDLAIVFTQINGTTKNNVYRIDFSKSETSPEITKIIAAVDLNITVSENNVWAINSVLNWESDDNIKMYWVDGHDEMKVINVDAAHDEDNVSATASSVKALPHSTLPPLELKGFGSGALTSGKIQYCYQLFHVRGTETALSALSKLYHLAITDDNSTSSTIFGDSSRSNSAKSVILHVDLDTSNFERAKIISIHYKNNTDLPEIKIIADIQIDGASLDFEDKGADALSELTIEEFNALASYPIIPETIEFKDNILFAANTTEVTWDVDYDARAYRCDSNGQIKVTSNSGQGTKSFLLSELTTDTVPEEHDAVCPYNSDDTAEYKYRLTDDGTLLYGGAGLNITWDFIVTNLIEDDDVPEMTGYANNTWAINVSANSARTMPMYAVTDGGSKELVYYEYLTSGDHVLNYSDPEIDAKYCSLQRDEIYSYGIVFYNAQNLASPVHWIADIRTPKATETGFEIFDFNYKANRITNSSIVTHPLGIRFSVNNLPDEATGFEIVRCERTLSDRSVLMQGIISDVYKKSDKLFPMPYLSYANHHDYFTSNETNHGYQMAGDNSSDSQFIFISPDICVNGEDSQSVVNRATTISYVDTLISKIYEPVSTSDYWPLTYKKAYDYNHDGSRSESTEEGFYAITRTDYCALYFVSKEEEYSATLAKYYQAITESVNADATIDEINVAENIDPFSINGDKFYSHGTLVGNNKYYNWCEWGDKDEWDGGQKEGRKVGPHGPCAVFKSSDLINQIPRLNNSPGSTSISLYYVNGVKVVNLKQAVTPYGGFNYYNRQNRTYISIGYYRKNYHQGGTVMMHTFGGDTYIGLFDYANVMFGFTDADYSSWVTNRIYNGAYFPCESGVNLSLLNNKYATSKTYETVTGYSNHWAETDIFVAGSRYSQATPLYAYNDMYSAEATAMTFAPKSLYNIDDLTTDTRVHYSEIKTNNEVTDSWTKFKVGNYLDVDSRFGPINLLKTFNNSLLFWQTDAFGVLSVHPRTLVIDDNPGALTLGTGGVLERYDYFTTKNGLKENQMRAVTNSDGVVYWYDYDRNEICAYNGVVSQVSKIKGVQSYLVSNKENFSMDPCTAYDKKYNEVLFTLEDKTLVYNERLGAFTSFYTIKPDRYIEYSDKLYTFKDLVLWKYNSGDESDLYTGKDKISYIVFTVNKDYAQTKTFDNVEYGGNFTDGTNFYSIIFNTKRQTSYETTDTGIDYREDTYKFAIPRNNIELNSAEELVNKSFKDRMKGKYLVCHYKYDCNGGNTFDVPYISTAFRNSMI